MWSAPRLYLYEQNKKILPSYSKFCLFLALQESLKLLATNFVECYYDMGFQDIKYVKTFQQLKDQFDHRPTSNTSLTDDNGVEGIDT